MHSAGGGGGSASAGGGTAHTLSLDQLEGPMLALADAEGESHQWSRYWFTQMSLVV
jgi:hypothetical protein